MNLLAIDTTTDVCSVALAANGDIAEHTRFAPKLHNEYLLALIDRALSDAGMERRAVQAIAFGGGPASFTGVRIGAAVAQGLAFAVGARVVPVPSSEIAAETVRLATGRRGVWRLSRPSRRGWRYVARYAFSEDGVRCLDFDELVPEDALATEVIDAEAFAVSARVVAALAAGRMDGAVRPAQALPYYVAGDSPWRAACPGAS